MPLFFYWIIVPTDTQSVFFPRANIEKHIAAEVIAAFYFLIYFLMVNFRDVLSLPCSVATD